MSAGDIILSDGTTITPEDLQKIAAAVENLIGSTAKDPGQYEEVKSLTGISSLPVFQVLGNTYKLVRVAVSVLKGVDGREVSLQVTNDYIQWRYTDGNWQNLIAIADLKGAAGETPVFRTGSSGIEWKYVSEPDTAYRSLVSYDVLKLKFSDLTTEQIQEFWEAIPADLITLFQKPATDAAEEVRNEMAQISEAASIAIKAANDAATNANNAAENVQDGVDGKTPSLEIGTVQGGTDPAASVTPAGTDATGNPKYKINLTLPAGANGLPPVLEQGTVTTGEPGTDALASLIANGQTVAGNPKYLLNLTLPRGQQGLPGTGSGNVSADGTGLLIGKKYLFVPSANGTTTGTFVEYVAPTIPEQVQPDWNATAGKAAILNKPTIPSKTSQLSNDSNFATKTDIGNHNTSAVAHSDIRQALSDVEAIARGKSRAKVFDTVAALDVWLGVSANVTTLQVGDNFYIKALDVPDYWWDGTAKQPIEAEKVDLTNYVQKEAGKGLFSGSYNDLSNKPTIPTVPGVATSTVDGLMSSADKRNLDAAVVPKNITTATTLTNLSIANYSIKVTLSSASALSFASTPAEGWECMIDIKNVEGGGSGPITQPLPNASGWQCDETSLTIAQGKIASISVRYIHGTYVVIAKGN